MRKTGWLPHRHSCPSVFRTQRACHPARPAQSGPSRWLCQPEMSARFLQLPHHLTWYLPSYSSHLRYWHRHRFPSRPCCPPSSHWRGWTASSRTLRRGPDHQARQKIRLSAGRPRCSLLSVRPDPQRCRWEAAHRLCRQDLLRTGRSGRTGSRRPSCIQPQASHSRYNRTQRAPMGTHLKTFIHIP